MDSFSPWTGLAFNMYKLGCVPLHIPIWLCVMYLFFIYGVMLRIARGMGKARLRALLHVFS